MGKGSSGGYVKVKGGFRVEPDVKMLKQHMIGYRQVRASIRRSENLAQAAPMDSFSFC
jgi:hypothetical protein